MRTRVVGGKDLRRISAELKIAADGKILERELRKNLRAVVTPLVPKVRSSISQIPAQRDAGLRTEMKRATRASVRLVGPGAQVTIMVDPDRMPPGKKNLPAYMEGKKYPWRHPVFGHTGTWVTQSPHPYFYEVVVPYARVYGTAAIYESLREVSRRIT